MNLDKRLSRFVGLEYVTYSSRLLYFVTKVVSYKQLIFFIILVIFVNIYSFIVRTAWFRLPLIWSCYQFLWLFFFCVYGGRLTSFGRWMHDSKIWPVRCTATYSVKKSLPHSFILGYVLSLPRLGFFGTERISYKFYKMHRKFLESVEEMSYEMNITPRIWG